MDKISTATKEKIKLETLDRKCWPRVVREIMRYGRWYVVLDIMHERFGRKEIPKATYVWLCANPSFKYLPKGYVIHHLDHNPLNDDLSNLALMQRHCHLAHHYKELVLRPDIEIDYNCYDVEKSIYFPSSEPQIYKRKDADWYFLRFRERNLDGSPNKYTTISIFEGERMMTVEEAQKVKDSIWPISQRAKAILNGMVNY